MKSNGNKGYENPDVQTLTETTTPYHTDIGHNDTHSVNKKLSFIQPSKLTSLFSLGMQAQKYGNLDDAIVFFSKIIEFDDQHESAIFQRGRTFAMQKRHESAIFDFTKVLSINSESYESFYSRGVSFSRQSKFYHAILDFTSAIQLNPRSPDLHYNRALAFKKLSEHSLALKDYTKAIELNPRHFQALNNRGLTYRDLKKFREALADFKECTKAKPDFFDGYWNRSLTHLMIGEYEEAWRLYEYRWKSVSFTSQQRKFNQPLWLGGSDLYGRTLLLHSEQGFGDTLQFSRYVQKFSELGCTIFLEVEKALTSIMECLLPKNQIIEKGDGLPFFDYHCPLMSLPLAFKTTRETVPYPLPYLFASQKRVQWWSEYLGIKTKQRIGIAWKGNPKHNNDQNRSIQLETFIKHLTSDCEWFSLQISISEAEQRLINDNDNIKHFGELIGDFAETAALCSVLDAVICVDTSIVHLAGSIGVPTHLLLAYVADARWHDKGEQTPWYNNVKIYRQSSDRSWIAPLQAAFSSLSNDKEDCTNNRP